MSKLIKKQIRGKLDSPVFCFFLIGPAWVVCAENSAAYYMCIGNQVSGEQVAHYPMLTW